jgi:maleylacetate reductase
MRMTAVRQNRGQMVESFSFADGERLIRFGDGALDEAPELLAGRGFERYALLTTPRAEAGAAALVAGADAVLHVQLGPVPEAAAAVREAVAGRPVVALGGGRVVDSAKAIGGADGLPVAAVPTTLSGAPFTPFHRMPTGVQEWRLARPSLVVVEPAVAASQPATDLAASAMNSLAHAMESLYTPLANPVAEAAALRAAELYADALPLDERDHGALALAATLAGYAVGVAGLAIHHALCQTLVRVCGTPHAETNAVVLPHSARLMVPRAPGAMGALAAALGDPAGDPEAAPGRIAKLAARSGHTRLVTLGVEERQLDEVVGAVMGHRGVALTPDPPGPDELLALLRAAL